MTPSLLEDGIVVDVAKKVSKTPAQVLLAWALQRGTAVLTTSKTPIRIMENFDVSALPDEMLDEINRIETRVRFNSVVTSGLPGFIPRKS